MQLRDSHLIRTLLALALGMLASAAPASRCTAQVWTIDPALGVDGPGRGSAQAPLKTIGYAARQAAALGTGAFLLRPGTYSNASGESFPIALPPLARVLRDPATRDDSAAVIIDTPLDLRTAFLIEGAMALDAVFEGLEIRGGELRGIQMLARGTKLTSALHVRDCRILNSRGIAVQANQGATVDVRVERCRLGGIDAALFCVASGSGSRLELELDHSRLGPGGAFGVYLEASNDAAIRAELRASILRGFGTSAIRSSSTSGGSIETRLEHLLLTEVGSSVIGGAVGALSDMVGSGGLVPRHAIANSIFTRNRADVSSPRGFGQIRFGANLVEQSSLATLGGNRLGTPSFASDDSFRLADGSLGLDLGAAAEVTLATDLDGLPRLAASSGAPDLGPFERHFGAVPPRTRDAAVGGRTTRLELAVQGPAATPCALLFGLPIATGFGPGLLHLNPPFVELGIAGVLDATGTRVLVLGFPNPGGLEGFVFGAQALLLAPPYLGAHAASIRLLR